eukprot:2388913-Pyramimonas_sp.AAC.1
MAIHRLTSRGLGILVGLSRGPLRTPLGLDKAPPRPQRPTGGRRGERALLSGRARTTAPGDG